MAKKSPAKKAKAPAKKAKAAVARTRQVARLIGKRKKPRDGGSFSSG